jgi:beta-phosphoglucomutase-like phosphatase (HAD superfamily)
MTIEPSQPVVLLDLDGTLVDSVFHHVLAWREAFTQAGYDVPCWRIHTGIGMGGQRLVPWLLGGQVPEAAEYLRTGGKPLPLEADANVA